MKGKFKKFFKLLCGAALLVTGTIGITQLSETVQAAEVAIDETNFLDENFRKCALKFDQNDDGILSDEEIESVKELKISSRAIWSLQGIEYFTSLEVLDCSHNAVQTLDISKNTALEILNCDNNQNLQTLDVSENTALKELNCSYNGLQTLDISKNTVLEVLNCSHNKLTILDPGNNSKLTKLNCSYNQLTSLLNISTNTELTILDCSNNQLVTLDLNQDTKWTSLKCSNNPLLVNPEDGAIGAGCAHIFSDYKYCHPVSSGAVYIYGNGKTSKNAIKFVTEAAIGFLKQITVYTDITASYDYTVNKQGKVKPISTKVVVGMTMTDTQPTLSKGKIVDKEAAKIAKAKITKGQITVTATGKQKGLVYLWVIDTGRKGVAECCPINVKLLPNKFEIQDISGNKVTIPKFKLGESQTIKIVGMAGSINAGDNYTYTAEKASSSEGYISVRLGDTASQFILTGTALKNQKDTKVSLTFTCQETGKKVKLTAVIQPS